MDKLLQVDGIGKSKAQELMNIGVKKVSDLRKHMDILPLQTKLYMQHKPSKKIKYDTISKFDAELNKLIGGKIKYDIVGSYRRKCPTSRDVDIVISDKSIDNFVKYIRKIGLLYEYLYGPDKLSGYLKLPTITIKIDIFRVDKSKYAFMLLYATGSKDWNIYMRHVAKTKGYLLNQNGLMSVKSKKYIRCSSEHCIFKKLGISYKHPEDRSYCFSQK